MLKYCLCLFFSCSVILSAGNAKSADTRRRGDSYSGDIEIASDQNHGEPEDADYTTDGEKVGVNIDFEVASAYVFRGLNVFQQDGQMNQHMLNALGLSWSILDTGLTIGYWGAFQVSGENIEGNINNALGLEQDLYAAYDLALSDDMGMSFGLTYYFYPAASETLTGASVPSYLEPIVGVSFNGILDTGINVSYFFGIQDEEDIRDISYLYINPTVGKSFELGDEWGLSLGIGYGYKLWKEDIDDNTHDIKLSVGLPFRPNDRLYVIPGINLAWTNLTSTDFAGELVFWGGVNIGVDL